jgi:hypothetical protein
MSKRRKHEQGFSLFSFLDTLMCTMGALILMLIVLSRSLRQQAELKAAQHEPPPPVAAAAPPMLEPPPVLAVAPSPRPAPERKVIIRRAAPQPEPPPIVVDPTYDQRRAAQLAAHSASQDELNRQWQGRVQKLTDSQSQLAQEVQKLQADLQQRQAALTALEKQSVSSTAGPQSDAEAAALAAAVAKLAQQRAAAREEIDAVARALQAVQARRAATPVSKYTFVPFDALSGTERRPIVIECHKDRMEFVCEGISLSPEDLDGFIPHFNPLAAGVKALHDGWTARDDGKPPYVLLVVRPEGTVSFYVARTYLQPLDIPFGYELVGPTQEFTWPQSDAAMVRECRRAIEETLRERPRVTSLARASGHLEEPLAVVGQGGQFRLEEVERMRAPTKTVQFGQQRVDRQQHTAGTGQGGGAGGGSGERRGLGLFRKPESQGATASAGGAPGGADAAPGPRPSDATRPQFASGAESPGGERAEQSSGEGSTSNDGWMSGPGMGGKAQVRDPYKWRPQLGSGLSVVRDVPVEISSTTMRICGGEAIAITPQTETEVLARHVAEALESESDKWGPPPKGYHWKPRIKFVVSGEGAPISKRLEPYVATWGLESTLDFASRLSRTPDRPQFSAPFRR